jgi:sigma-B regulation protein RsbQ
MDLLERHAVRQLGPAGAPAIVFAHGFGCSQDMWRLVAPAFAEDHRVVLFDHVGAGAADPAAYDPVRHGTLRGYAEDVVELLRLLDAPHVTFVGHSVSSMIGVLVDVLAPELVQDLVLVCPSPRYLDDDGYRGGFGRPDMEELLGLIDRNYVEWAAAMAPTIMGNADRPQLAGELEASFCRTDAEIAKRFARATFLADNRADLRQVTARTLVLQSAEDAIAPIEVGQFVAGEIPGARLDVLDVRGHCPNLSAPEVTTAAIRRFLASREALVAAR